LLEFDYNRIALRMGLGFSQENAEQIFPIGELLQPKGLWSSALSSMAEELSKTKKLYPNKYMPR
jgi:hypothetical protein